MPCAGTAFVAWRDQTGCGCAANNRLFLRHPQSANGPRKGRHGRPPKMPATTSTPPETFLRADSRPTPTRQRKKGKRNRSNEGSQPPPALDIWRGSGVVNSDISMIRHSHQGGRWCVHQSKPCVDPRRALSADVRTQAVLRIGYSCRHARHDTHEPDIGRGLNVNDSSP